MSQKLQKQTTETKLEFNSEQMRLAANYALQGHAIASKGGQMLTVGALVSGFSMSFAKEQIPHGQFEKWQKKFIGQSISRRTAKLYMQIVGRLKEQEASKCASVAHLLKLPPHDLTETHIQRLSLQVAEIADGKTFAELGRELGVFKPRDTKARKAEKKRGPRTGIDDIDKAHDAKVWVDEIAALLEPAKLFKDDLDDKELTRVVNLLKQAIVDLGVINIVED